MKSRKVKILCGSLAAIAVLYILLLQYMIYRHSHMETPGDADYLIVLGARVRGSTPSLSLKYRIDAAAQYLQENERAVAIVSGGQGSGEDITEAEAMKRGLMKQGISKERIILEGESTDTGENIAFSKKLIPDGAKTGVIVTNDYHLYRAKMIARKQGLHLAGLPAETPRISVFKAYTREYVAITKYLITGEIRLYEKS